MPNHSVFNRKPTKFLALDFRIALNLLGQGQAIHFNRGSHEKSEMDWRAEPTIRIFCKYLCNLCNLLIVVQVKGENNPLNVINSLKQKKTYTYITAPTQSEGEKSQVNCSVLQLKVQIFHHYSASGEVNVLKWSLLFRAY